MKAKIAALALAGSIGLSGCTGVSQSSIGDRPLTKDFEVDGITWNRSKASTVLFFKVFEREGKVALCGAFTYDKALSGGTESLHRRALNAIAVELDGETLQNNVSYFNFVPSTVLKQGGGTASCVQTQRAWNDDFNKEIEPEIRMMKNRFVTYS